MEYRLAGGLAKAPSTHFLDCSKKRCRRETFIGLTSKGPFLSLLSVVPVVSASDGARKEIRSCVARAEPKNKLCGMTVAPRIPTARETSRC